MKEIQDLLDRAAQCGAEAGYRNAAGQRETIRAWAAAALLLREQKIHVSLGPPLPDLDERLKRLVLLSLAGPYDSQSRVRTIWRGWVRWLLRRKIWRLEDRIAAARLRRGKAEEWVAGSLALILGAYDLQYSRAALAADAAAAPKAMVDTSIRPALVSSLEKSVMVNGTPAY